MESLVMGLFVVLSDNDRLNKNYELILRGWGRSK